MFVNTHVDGILLVCKPGDVGWFQSTVGETLTMRRSIDHMCLVMDMQRKESKKHVPGDGS